MTETPTKSGIVGGTLLASLLNITFDDVVFTIVMASIGAVVSYFVSMFLKQILASLKTKLRGWK